MSDLAILFIAGVCAAVLLNRRLRENRQWRATVTPLASIIGSGFLVIAPLLGHAAGGFAPVAMLGIVVLAYALGGAIRFNIVHTEPLLRSGGAPFLRAMEGLSDLLLVLAYFISVTFYLRLLSSFLLRGFSWNQDRAPEIVATALLLVIGFSGWFGGLRALEKMEALSVSIKLSVIAALLLAWANYDLTIGAEVAAEVPRDFDGWHTLRILAGVLIVVQGFETSRYLGDEYDASSRVRSMRRAQWISGLIYVAFVALVLPALGQLPADPDETALIDLSRPVAHILPPMLIVAAVMSQFSAAIADTLGAGGLVGEIRVGRRKITLDAKIGYVAVAAIGILLVWIADVFQIIALASRAFALYYAVQCATASWSAGKLPWEWKRNTAMVGYAALAVVLLGVTIFALPAD